MQSKETEGILSSEVIREKYPCYSYAVYFLEQDDIMQRKVGYSLLAPLFRLLPKDLQEYIKYIWQIEGEKHRMPFSFVKCCNQIFIEGENQTS